MAVLLSWVLGIVLTLVGIAGFFTGDMLLMFEINTIHNVIHLLSGLVGLYAASKGAGYARQYLMIFGIIYGVVAVLGFTMDGNVLGLLHANTADNYLHLAIAVVSIVVGFGKKS